MSVGIVTYVMLKAGLLNKYTAGNISLICEYGVTGIAGKVKDESMNKVLNASYYDTTTSNYGSNTDESKILENSKA